MRAGRASIRDGQGHPARPRRSMERNAPAAARAGTARAKKKGVLPRGGANHLKGRSELPQTGSGPGGPRSGSRETGRSERGRRSASGKISKYSGAVGTGSMVAAGSDGTLRRRQREQSSWCVEEGTTWWRIARDRKTDRSAADQRAQERLRAIGPARLVDIVPCILRRKCGGGAASSEADATTHCMLAYFVPCAT